MCLYVPFSLLRVHQIVSRTNRTWRAYQYGQKMYLTIVQDNVLLENSPIKNNNKYDSKVVAIDNNKTNRISQELWLLNNTQRTTKHYKLLYLLLNIIINKLQSIKQTV